MPRYSVFFSNVSNADGNKLIYTAANATPVRHAWTYFTIGSRAAVSDDACNYEIQRITDENATPAGTAITPRRFDEEAPAASANAVQLATGAPTLGDLFMNMSGNKRITLQWYAQHQGEIWVKAAEDNGLLIMSDTPTTAFNVHGCIHFIE